MKIYMIRHGKPDYSYGDEHKILQILSVVVILVVVTGVTLPFLFSRGSSLLVSMVSIGIILNISRNI